MAMITIAANVVEALLGSQTVGQKKEEIVAAFQAIGKPVELVDLEGLSDFDVDVLYSRFVDSETMKVIGQRHGTTRHVADRRVRHALGRILRTARRLDMKDVGQDSGIFRYSQVRPWW